MKYISILRGINVSGQKKILMADLKALYIELGFTNVLTYIQSGNVIFGAKIKDRIKLKSKIEVAIKNKYNFKVPIIVRTHGELEEIIKQLPFDEIDLIKNSSRVAVTFLESIPAEEKVADLLTYVKEPEILNIIGKNVYLYCPNGFGRTKLSINFIEKKLNVIATSRNWKTVNKLFELSGH
jgi:uncharacterized protein (DUF1697 family)